MADRRGPNREKMPLESGIDRRESPRVPMRFRVRPAGEGEFVEYEGDLAGGGVFLKSPTPPAATRFDIRIKLPKMTEELEVRGETIGVRRSGEPGVHVKFIDIDFKLELAIARYLDDLA